MENEVISKTGGQIDDLCMALIDAANDKQNDVKDVIIMSLHEIGKKQPEMVLSTIKVFLIKHQKLSQGHRVVLLKAAARVIQDSLSSLDLELSKTLIKLASIEMTRSKEVEPEWQTAASEVLVALGKRFDHEVMAELLDKLAPGCLPHYFVVHTLASFSTANAFGVVPFLKDILGRMLPILGMAKQDNMKWVFANCLGRFSESILEYIANVESAPYPDISIDRFYGEIYSAYDVLFNIWLKSNEPKIRIAVVDAIGHMTHIMSHEKLEEQLPKLLPGITGLYKKHTDHYLITQGLCSVLDAACSDGSAILAPHLDALMNGLHNMACSTPDFSHPLTVKNHNELLRCFSVLTQTFSDRVLAFLLAKLEAREEKVRIGSLLVLKHLVNSSGTYLENKEDLIVSGVQILLMDNNLKVQRSVAQAITAMAHHRYLELEGGLKLLEYIIKLCSLSDDEHKQQHRPNDPDPIRPRSLRLMSVNILYLLTTTVDVMEMVLWPNLLEFLIPEQFTNGIGAVCKSLAYIAAKKREEQAADYNIDFDVQRNVPPPAALIARLIVVCGHPMQGEGRGIHVLKLLLSLVPILHTDLVEMWDTVIPKLIQYLEENSDDSEKWNQKSWEDLVLKLLSKSLDEVDSDEWACSVGQEMGSQLSLYDNRFNDKNFAFKCLGIVLRKVKQKGFLQTQLDIMFSTIKHSSQEEREGCAIGIGFCAATNLDSVLSKLEQVSKTDMVKKSGGILGFMKDKTDVNVERVKSTVMLCYGYATFYGPPSLITSRLEANIFRNIIKHFSNVKDTTVKQNLTRAVELIGKALEPSRLQQPDFVFSRRAELMNHMLAYIKVEPTTSISTETRALAMDACSSLIKLNPRLSDAELFDMVKTCTESVFPVSLESHTPTKGQKTDIAIQGKDPSDLLSQALQSVNNLLKEILLRDPLPQTFSNILKHLESPWLHSQHDHERQRAVNCIHQLVEVLKQGITNNVVGKPNTTFEVGLIVARIVPRCTDPLISIRQTAIECVQNILRISLWYQGYSIDSKDDLIDALSTLKERASEEDPNILFSVASDLSKVIAKKLLSDVLSGFVFTLMDGLTDCQSHSSSGACVVLNSIIRIRGQELRKEVGQLVMLIHDKLWLIAHPQTRTGTLRVMRTLASHHLAPVLTAILEFSLPLDEHVVDIWKTLAGEPGLALSILEYLQDLLTRSLPYNEKPNPKSKKEILRIATLQPCAITCGLTEMFGAEETTELALENFHRLFSMSLLRLGTCVSLKPPEPPTKDKKDKTKHPTINPLSTALELIKALLVRCQYIKLIEFIDKGNVWKRFEDEKEFPEGITLLARGICTLTPQHVAKITTTLQTSFCSVYDAQRIVIAAFFSELIDQHCGGNAELVDLLMTSLLGRLVDTSQIVRKYCIRGLGNISSVGDSKVEQHSTTILSAMMAGMDDKDDPEDEITLESMSGLSKVLAKLDENHVRQILINICLRVRPCFEKEKTSVRAAAFILFGKLSRFGDGPSKTPFLEQIHTNFISILLHLNEEQEVAKGCKECLRSIGPLIGSHQINAMFQKHLIEEGHLHYGEFMNDLSRLIISDFSEKVNFYVMGCVSFFKSTRDDIKANAAIFVGFLLGNLGVDNRDDISKDHVCGALVMLLKDPSSKVRCKAAEAMSLLYDY